MNKETVVGAFPKPSSGRSVKPIHSTLYIIVEPVEKVKNGYDGNSIQTLERVYKYYYFIIRERNINGRKIIRIIVHVNAHTGKQERYEEIEER